MTTALTLFLILSLILHPQAMLHTSLNTTSLWLSKVFPSLFPFMVCSSILLNSKGIDYIAKLLKPVMHPLFKLSGIASFPLVIGIVSGYPMGAKITSELYAERKISLADAKHLLCFTNNAGSLFLIGTVGTGFLNSPELGYLLLLSCVINSIFTGFVYGLLKKKNSADIHIPSLPPTEKTQPPFFELLSTAISNSLISISQIGGFMLFFSILITACENTGILSLFYIITNTFNIPQELVTAIFSGFLEMTTGTFMLSSIDISTNVRLIFITVLVCFGSCSILGQTFAIISNIPIKKSHYILAKLINACSGGIIISIIYNFFYTPKVEQVFYSIHNKTSIFYSIHTYLFLSFFILILILLVNKKTK